MSEQASQVSAELVGALGAFTAADDALDEITQYLCRAKLLARTPGTFAPGLDRASKSIDEIVSAIATTRVAVATQREAVILAGGRLDPAEPEDPTS